MEAMRVECERPGVRWLRQRFPPRQKVVTPALSMLRMVWLMRSELQGQSARLIHARSYIPAAVGIILSRMGLRCRTEYRVLLFDLKRRRG